MSERNLTKKEALELITPVVDDEVDRTTRQAFFKYIENNDDVRVQYESAKRIKQVIAERCPCARAPARLRKKIYSFLSASAESADSTMETEEPIYDIPSDQPVDAGPDKTSQSNTAPFWPYAAAAALLIVALLGGIFLYGGPGQTYNVEEYAYNHFVKYEGRMVTPTITTASLSDAELKLADFFNISMIVPPLKNAELKGIVWSDFVDGFKAPMFEYHLPTQNQYVYIFAFKIGDLNRFERLSRSEEAVNSCIKSQDFHIRNVKGKHIVSWKWEDTWYAAISNHDGKTLASLVEPLNYDSTREP